MGHLILTSTKKTKSFQETENGKKKLMEYKNGLSFVLNNKMLHKFTLISKECLSLTKITQLFSFSCSNEILFPLKLNLFPIFVCC